MNVVSNVTTYSRILGFLRKPELMFIRYNSRRSCDVTGPCTGVLILMLWCFTFCCHCHTSLSAQPLFKCFYLTRLQNANNNRWCFVWLFLSVSATLTANWFFLFCCQFFQGQVGFEVKDDDTVGGRSSRVV